MNSKLYTTLLFFICSLGLTQAQDFWQVMEAPNYAEGLQAERSAVPQAFQVGILDSKRFTKALNKAGVDLRDGDTNTSVISLLMADGSLESFYVWDSPSMHPNLAAKYPSIKSYRILSTTNALITGRITMTAQGLHASISTPQGVSYIDPFYADGGDLYFSYYTKDDVAPDDMPKAACGVDVTPDDIGEFIESSSLQKAADIAYYKKYRFALACTGEWGQNFSSKEQVLATMVTAVDRINQSLENEASVFFELIENNDELIFMDPTSDPYVVTPSQEDGVHPGRQVLGQNTGVINSVIGGNNYDVGHVFTRSCTDGIAGVASLGSVCTSGGKGAGLSCVGNANVVSFMVNVTLHELGHQFGASHSWSNCSEGSNSNLSAGTAYEPGSGSTFMSYAGVCSQQNNVQGGSDDYFHIASMIQVYNVLEGGNGSLCGENIDFGNTKPEVTISYPNDLVIPIFTPFELTGEGFDAEGDPLTYCWEQHNKGPLSILGSPQGNAPAFRSYPPDESPTRVFPRMYKILNNITENSEVLQTVGRDYTFYLTVRDNHAGGGSAAWDKMSFSSSGSAGPFYVIQPNNAEELVIGKPYTFMWDVAETNKAPVNCQGVDIILSANGGDDFDIVLAQNVPNDGEHDIVIPNHPTTEGRIKIKASENIFFDVSNFDFDIVAPNEPSFYFALSEFKIDVCAPEVVDINVDMESFLEFSNDVNLEVVTDLPAETVITLMDQVVDPMSEGTSLNLDFTNVNATGEYTVDVIGTAEGSDTLLQSLQVTLTSGNFDDMALIYPEPDISGVTEQPTFEWNDAINADTYTLEYGKNPALGSTGERITGLISPTYTPPVNLDKNSLYYWRVYAENKCNDAITGIQMFATESLSCDVRAAEDLPISISQSSTPEIQSVVFFAGAGQVTDVNVKNISGIHENVENLSISLVSPAGTSVLLVDNRCDFMSDFNCGFDDASPSELSCPLSQAISYVPEESLSIFNGEDLVGNWTLIIKDEVSGEGGQFNRFDLEVCSNATLQSPELVNNNILEVPTGGSNRINTDLLLAEDENNTAEELIYTLVRIPEHGILTIYGEEAIIGSTFSQSDIDEKAIRYQHNGSEIVEDGFHFTVIDGEGGWINLTPYVINMDENFTSSVLDEGIEYFSFNAFPNPTSNAWNIKISTEESNNFNLRITDLTGKQYIAKSLKVDNQRQLTVPCAHLPEGMYIVTVQNDVGTKSLLTTIQR